MTRKQKRKSAGDWFWEIIGVAVVVAVIYAISSVHPPITHTGPYGSENNPISFGNWYTSIGTNYWGSGYYTLPNGSEVQVSSEVQLTAYVVSNKLPEVR